MTDRIVLDERLDTGAATALAAQLSKLDPGGSCVLDGHRITHLGAQATQVIISAARTVRATGGSVTCEAFSDRGTAQLAAIGLTVDDLMEVSP
ncbi:STAS domain-containing protein [Tateyamaria sp. SN6-1]|uniref:STAS domain-containing protein n=1 Tax=Tateyamaria sp. SN6-1 TaxID=3092148 RepID=UPI0039F57CAF